MAGINGRPTKLTQDFINKADEYMDCWEELGEVIPSIAGLSVYTRVSRDSIHSWAAGEWPSDASESTRESFSDIVTALGATQELKLMNGGLGGAMNPTIAKLLLHKHGHSEKVQQDNVSSDGSMGLDNLNITVTKP